MKNVNKNNPPEIVTNQFKQISQNFFDSNNEADNYKNGQDTSMNFTTNPNNMTTDDMMEVSEMQFD